MADKDRPRRRVRDRRDLFTPLASPKPPEKMTTDEAVAELIEQIKRQNESN
jgi:hypothetical protein